MDLLDLWMVVTLFVPLLLSWLGGDGVGRLGSMQWHVLWHFVCSTSGRVCKIVLGFGASQSGSPRSVLAVAVGLWLAGFLTIVSEVLLSLVIGESM